MRTLDRYSALTFAMLALSATVACSDSGDDPPAGNADAGSRPDAGGGGSVLPSSITCNAQNVCTVPVGDYATDMTWSADKTFVLSLGAQAGPANVAIRSPATLTIEPGTRIFANGQIALLVDRGAKIEAVGTAQQPIVFSSAKEDGMRARGDWGGIIINGRAPANCTSNMNGCQGEGSSGEYGGPDVADDSGALKYVRVEFAGAKITETNEYNGVALQGVGSGTEIDHLQVHLPSDDGVEFFGGTVNAKHIVVTGAGDDSLDWTFGWSGKVQFVAVVQYDDDADSGIEADNNEFNFEAMPRSSPVISNLTLVGRAASTGAVLRRGTAVQIWNSVFTGSGWCIDIDSIPSTFTQLTMGSLVLRNTVHNCTRGAVRTNDEVDAMMMPLMDADANGPVDAAMVITTQQMNNRAADPLLTVANTAGSRPSFVPAAGSPALTGGGAPSDTFFEPAAFQGAMTSGADWTADWTDYPSN